VACGSHTSAGDCPSDTCVFGCCGPGGPPGQGCAGCCMDKSCQGFDAAHCPLARCILLPSCAGGSVCYPPFSAPPPACGAVSYYGAQVACCQGLSLRCGQPQSDGSCAPEAGGYNGIPECLACGDGTCEQPFENRCNCPEDCTPPAGDASDRDAPAIPPEASKATPCHSNADCGAGRACYTGLTTGCLALGTCVPRLAASCSGGVGTGCPCLDLSAASVADCPARTGAACWGDDLASQCWHCNVPQ
jgi:hypothetical protein